MLETAIVLLLAIGFCTLVCTVYSRVLTPDSAEDTWAVVRGIGPGDGLEQRVRSLMWLRSLGLLRCRVVLAVGALDADGQVLARNLARRWPELELRNDALL